MTDHARCRRSRRTHTQQELQVAWALLTFEGGASVVNGKSRHRRDWWFAGLQPGEPHRSCPSRTGQGVDISPETLFRSEHDTIDWSGHSQPRLSIEADQAMASGLFPPSSSAGAGWDNRLAPADLHSELSGGEDQGARMSRVTVTGSRVGRSTGASSWVTCTVVPLESHQPERWWGSTNHVWTPWAR